MYTLITDSLQPIKLLLLKELLYNSVYLTKTVLYFYLPYNVSPYLHQSSLLRLTLWDPAPWQILEQLHEDLRSRLDPRIVFDEHLTVQLEQCIISNLLFCIYCCYANNMP